MDLKEVLKIPSVGKSIGEKIDEFVRTGSFEALEELRAQIPPGVREMIAIPGLGPKKAIVLYRELGIADVEQLGQAVEQGRLAELKGFGAKTEENIRRGIERMNQSTGRVLVSVAMDLADYFLERLGGRKDVRRMEYAGSLRRMAETIGDLDLLVASDDPIGVIDAFTSVGMTGPRAREGRHEVVDPHAQGAPGRPARGTARGLGRRDDLLHGFQAPQHPDPRDGRAQGAQAQRVRVVPRQVGQAHRGGDRGGGLREALAAVDPAHAPRGPRRGRGGARGHPARRAHAQAAPRRPAHTHRSHGRAGLARTDARDGLRAPVRVLRGHRPRAEPVHAADDRREDARATRAAPEAAGPPTPR